jgi:hypothetical protein
MHDIDRSFLELEPLQGAFWSAMPTQAGHELGQAGGITPSAFAREVAAAASPLGRELAAGRRQPGPHVLDEVTEMELASELLGAQTDHELDHFLGGLLNKVGSFLGSALHSSVGQEILGGLKDIARKALPAAGAALGNFLVPGVGGNIGRMLAQDAGKALGLELEAMSPADQEFEVARRVVRLGAHAARHAAGFTPATPTEAVRAAQVALATAARDVAPGLLRPAALAGAGNGTSPLAGSLASTAASLAGSLAGAGSSLAETGVERRGEWVRKGDRILLIGV